MEKQKEEIQNKEEEKTTPDNTDQVDEQNISKNQEQEGDEMVQVSKKKLETFEKKANDFDASIELRRLRKLEAKKSESSGDEKDAILNEIRSLKEEIHSFKATQKNSVLKEAYKDFISEHKWADDDTVFSKISEEFDASDLNSKEEITNKLKSLAMSKFPSEYEKHLLSKAQSKAWAEKSNISKGEGSGNSAKNQFAEAPETEEEKISDSFYRDFPKGFEVKKDK